MAFYNNQNNTSGALGMNKPEDEENQQNAMSGGTAPMQLTGASVNGAQNDAPMQPNKPAASGMAPGFQSYAKANQGAATNNLVNAAQSNVQNLGQQAQTSITQATNKFGQKVDTGSLKNRYQAVQDVANAVNSARNITAPITPTPAAAPANTGIVPPAAPAAPAQANPNAMGGMDQSQVNRFKEVINAKYQGPESLRQAGLYTPAAQNVNAANQAVKNTGTAQGREELLRSMYEKRGDYTRGQNKLDTALLNSSKQGVQNLQSTADNFKNVSNDLTKAQINSGAMAQNRTQEIKGIQEQARNTFTEGKKAEEAATEKRIADMTTKPVLDAQGKPVLKADGTPMTEWDRLPEYFRDVIKNKGSDNTALQASVDTFKQQNGYAAAVAALEAAKKKAAKTGVARFLSGSDQEKQIAKNDAVKKAQAKLSGLDADIADLNKQVILNPFEAAAIGVQSGEGLYNLGEKAIKTAAADKEKLISRDEQARQAVLAQLAGLDEQKRLDTNLAYSNAEKAGTQSATDAFDTAATRAAINEAEKNFRESAQSTTLTGTGYKKNKTNGKKYYANQSANFGDVLSKAGYDLKADLNDQVGGSEVLNKVGKVVDSYTAPDARGIAAGMEGMQDGLDLDGKGLAQNALDIFGTGTGFNAITGALGMGSLGNAIGGALGFGGANTAASKSEAKQIAAKDLTKRIDSHLDTTGFHNRVNVQNNGMTNDRLAALQKLLQSLDQTNRKG